MTTDMADILPYRSPRASERATAYIGMIIFIAGFGMMFACFFFAYGALRLGAPEWPPLGQPMLPLDWPGANVAVIALSSISMELGLWAARRGKSKWLAPSLAAAAIFAIVFLLIQWNVGAALYAAGLTPTAGPYASVFYGLAGIHGMHVAIGLFALAYLFVQALRGVYNTPSHLPVRLWSIYWHFVGAIWALMFVLVFAV